MTFYVYILHCSDGSFYVGHTDNLEARLIAHRRRVFCGYTAKRLPVRLVYQDTFPTREEAFAAERQIKGWSRAKKLSLIQGDVVELKRQSLRRSPQADAHLARSARGS
ncbi:MAG TPA: GIY-YIG nuclease family protein [Dehalococcoidia bacterium]|nr:GIY-YIG nuclease family protein [Dehalococcoidia bacterium]